MDITNADNTVSSLQEKFPFRDEQITSLLSALGLPNQSPWPCIYIHGHSSTGKSTLLNDIIQQLNHLQVTVNLVECYNTRTLFELILQPLYGTHVPCDTMNDFIHKLSHKCRTSNARICLVVERAERLRKMETHIMPALLRLSDLTQCDINVILISTLSWERCVGIGTSCCYAEPYIIYFPEYNKDELEYIVSVKLSEEFGSEYKSSLYQVYASLFVKVVFSICRNLTEILFHAISNFGEFASPVGNKEVKENNLFGLWKYFRPKVRDITNAFYLREVKSGGDKQQDGSVKHGDGSTSSNDERREYIELPYYSKYLLIAAYLASYNPVKCDKLYFVKHTAKKSVRSKKMNRKSMMMKLDKYNRHVMGPKSFPITRLLAIFHAISEQKIHHTALFLHSQIATLVNLRLLHRVSCEDELSEPKYKCSASLSYVRNISRTLSFDIMMYLYDFQT